MLPRHKLPQIPSDRYEEFIAFLQEEGVEVKFKRLPIIQLKPIQQHVNRVKVEGMKKNPEALSIPIVVSQKMYILDGHHRWVSRKELDEAGYAICIWCNCPIRQLIELGHEFEYSVTKSVYEQRISFRQVWQ